MIFSLTLLLGYLSSSLKTAKEEMDSTSKDAEKSELASSLDLSITPSKHGRIPAFIRDKLAYFKTNGSTIAAHRLHLRVAEDQIMALVNQCKAMKNEIKVCNAKKDEVTKAFEEKLTAMATDHKAKMSEMQDKSNLATNNMDQLLKDQISLNQAKEKIAKQLKEAEMKIRRQENTKGVLSHKLHLAEKSRSEILKKLEEFEAKYAENMARFQTKYKNQEAAYGAKLSEQEAMFESKYSEQKFKQQESTFDSKFKAQQAMFDTNHNKQRELFDAKFKEQQDTFGNKCKEQKATFDAVYKAQQVKFDNKFRQQEVHFAARLQGERRKLDEMQKRNDAVTERLKNTETALLKSRQVKVNQEYEFTDTMNNLVPREALMTVQDQCQLYKKTISVLAAIVLVLLVVVFVGSRFLFY
ncbi:CAP-Gly domain-containing linker protein 1-like [Patiria miniata]|uniref:Uncharacterized protein n=1 Tax=Patiria miniata TaxID=46514 RepID=A0A914BRY0_PATMI|nr:CAP-Gly domain-containing linker protein 1-like [Patiria miniata]